MKRVFAGTLECGNGSKNHGVEVSRTGHLLNELVAAGNVSGADRGAIQRCVASTK